MATVVSFDPGSKNFGFACSKVTASLTVLEVGQIEATVSNLTNAISYKKITKLQREKAKAKGKPRLLIKDQPSTPPFMDGLGNFYRTINTLMSEYRPNIVIAERFQTRGLKGTTIEAISIMLGVIALYCHRNKIQFILVTAATWKNQANRLFKLDDFYVVGKDMGFTPHECDALIMGLYAASKEKGNMEKWITQVPGKLKSYARKRTLADK